MEKPANQDVVSLLLDVLRGYLSPLRPAGDPDLDLETLTTEVVVLDDPAFEACLALFPAREAALRSLYLLSGVGYGIVRPVFSRTDAIGSLMRSRLAPVFEVLRSHILSLQG